MEITTIINKLYLHFFLCKSSNSSYVRMLLFVIQDNSITFMTMLCIK